MNAARARLVEKFIELEKRDPLLADQLLERVDELVEQAKYDPGRKAAELRGLDPDQTVAELAKWAERAHTLSFELEWRRRWADWLYMQIVEFEDDLADDDPRRKVLSLGGYAADGYPGYRIEFTEAELAEIRRHLESPR